MRRQTGKLKRVGWSLTLAIFVFTTLLSLLVNTPLASAVIPNDGGSSAADPSLYTLVFPDDERTARQLEDAADDGIGVSDGQGTLGATYLLTHNTKLGAARLDFDKDRSDDEDVPTYKLDYYCSPANGYQLTLAQPGADKPYIRYTMGVTIMKPDNFKGIVDNKTYETHVGLLGDDNVGTVHFPGFTKSNGDKQGSKDFDIPAGNGTDYGLKSGVNGSKFDLGIAEYDFKNYGIGDSSATIFSKCLPNPRGAIGNKTSNYNKLDDDAKGGWDAEIKSAGLGDDARSAASGSSSGGDPDTSPDCQSGKDPLNWILCPIFDGVAAASDFLFEQLVEPLLHTAPISTNPSDCDGGNGNCTYQIWSNFRIYGNIFLIIALLVIVFGQSIGGGLVDAYTAKKVLPRIIAAAVLINLSLYIVAALVDITNIVGASIGTLLTAPLQDAGAFKITPSGVQAGTILGSGAAAAGIGALLIKLASGKQLLALFDAFFSGALLFIVLPVFLGLMAAFITLILRQAIILALVLVSPIAFALYCLPNTERFFRKWWEFLVQTLLVYPIVIIIFAISDVLSVMVYHGNTNDQVFAGSLAAVISFVLQFLPLLLIPFAFKLAGGALGRLIDVFSGYQKQVAEGVKGNPNDPHSRRRRYGYKMRDQATSMRERAVEAGVYTTGANRRRRLVGRMLNYGNLQARRSEFNRQRSEMLQNQIATGDDRNIRDLFIAWDADHEWTDNDGKVHQGAWFRRMDMRDGHALPGASRIYDDHETGRLAHGKAMNLYGGDMSAVQDALYYEWKKTSFDPAQMDNIESQYGEILDEHGFSEQQGSNMMTGVGFRHAPQSLASKYTRFSRDPETREWGWRTDHLGMTKEMAHNFGTYEMSRQDVSTFDEAAIGYQRMQEAIATAGPQMGQDEVFQDGHFRGRTRAQVEEGITRLEQMADTLNPDQRAPGAPQQVATAEGDGGQPQFAGYGGVSNAPVEVQEAARRFYATVRGGGQPNPNQDTLF